MKLYHSQIYPLTTGCILFPEITICQKPYTLMGAAGFNGPVWINQAEGAGWPGA